MKILKYILIIVFSSSVCFAQPSKDSINEAIERLQAKIDIGINFRDYQIELGNLQYEYNKYYREYEKWDDTPGIDVDYMRKELSILGKYLSILSSYRFCLVLWDYKIKTGEDFIYTYDNKYIYELVERNPWLREAKNETKRGKKRYTRIEAIIQIIWEETEDEYNK